MNPLVSLEIAMRPAMPQEIRQRVLNLRRTNSLAEVAKLTSLPLGTVKTICSRSGTRRDNAALRLLMTLPEPRMNSGKGLALPELPPAPRVVTGMADLDSLLWLHEIIATGDERNIARALTAAKRIKTPLASLRQTYVAWLSRDNPEAAWKHSMMTMDFDDLEAKAERAIHKSKIRADALLRFHSEDALIEPTPADKFCMDLLIDMELDGVSYQSAENLAAARFRTRPELMPHTLSDCMHELKYWNDLSTLRNSFGMSDAYQESSAREDFVFAELAVVRPRDRAEAVSVLRYMGAADAMKRQETDAILLNLVG